MLGVCGRYEYGLISCAAELLFLLLQSAPPSETEAQLVASLRQTHFLLGDRARYVALALMLRVAASPGSPSPLSVLTAFFQDVWQLHQIEDTDALPTSDEVARFTIKFS